MKDEDRELDKLITITPEGVSGKLAKYRNLEVSLDVIKSKYIAEGKSAEEISKELLLPVQKIREIVEDHKLPELRKAYVIEGIQKIQNTQLQQSHKLLDLENNFKKMRIIQLEKVLEDHLAYYARHGDFYKRHPTSGEILLNSDGIPMQISLPNVAKELSQLKESVTVSEGVRGLLHRLDEIINTGRPAESAEDPDTFDITEYDTMFEASED